MFKLSISAMGAITGVIYKVCQSTAFWCRSTADRWTDGSRTSFVFYSVTNGSSLATVIGRIYDIEEILETLFRAGEIRLFVLLSVSFVIVFGQFLSDGKIVLVDLLLTLFVYIPTKWISCSLFLIFISFKNSKSREQKSFRKFSLRYYITIY